MSESKNVTNNFCFHVEFDAYCKMVPRPTMACFGLKQFTKLPYYSLCSLNAIYKMVPLPIVACVSLIYLQNDPMAHNRIAIACVCLMHFTKCFFAYCNCVYLIEFLKWFVDKVLILTFEKTCKNLWFWKLNGFQIKISVNKPGSIARICNLGQN